MKDIEHFSGVQYNLFICISLSISISIYLLLITNIDQIVERKIGISFNHTAVHCPQDIVYI